MRFNRGDKAIITHSNPCTAALDKGDIVIVLDINTYGGYTVRKLGELPKWEVDETCLEKYENLPMGHQLTLENITTNTCDCGGWSAYHSMEPQYHSASLPCSSLGKKCQV